MGIPKNIMRMAMKTSAALMLTGLVAYFAAQPFLDLQDRQSGDIPTVEEPLNHFRSPITPFIPAAPERKVEEILPPAPELPQLPIEPVEPESVTAPEPEPKTVTRTAPKPRTVVKRKPKPKPAAKAHPPVIVPQPAPMAKKPKVEVQEDKLLASPAPLKAPPPILEPVEPMDDDSLLENIVPIDPDFGDDELIVDVVLRRELIYRGLFCLEKNLRPFIPVNELCSLLGIAITADETGARGWYIKETNTFSFDSTTGEVVNKGEHSKLPPEAYVYQDEELFIDMEYFSQLLPLDMKLNRNSLVLIITPREVLPYEMMKSRRAKDIYTRAKRSLIYPISDLDYSALAPPQIQGTVGAGYTSKKKQDIYSTKASGLFRGDLLFMSTTLYGSANFKKADKNWKSNYSDFSFAGERKFVDNPYITKFLIGDIPTASAAYISGGSLERGARVTNQGSGGDNTQWSRTFTGKALPGWDVELYQNNQRVGIQTIDEGGTYSFEDIPMSYGTNTMQLKLYGPQGQEEVREEVVNIGNKMKKGEVQYDLSISQKGKGVFEEQYSKVKTVSEKDQGSYRFNGKLKAGLLSTMSTEIGLGKDSSNGKDRYKGSLSLAGGYDGIMGKGTIAHSSKGSNFLDGSVGKRLDNGLTINANGMYQFSDNYEESNTKNSLAASLIGRDELKKDMDISYSVRGRRDQYEVTDNTTDDVKYTVSGGLGLNTGIGYFGTNLSTTLYTQSAANKGASVYGSSNYSRTFEKGNIRAGISYNQSDSESFNARSTYLSGSYRFNKNYRTTGSINKGLADSDHLSIKNTISYSGSKFSPYLTTSWNNNDTYSMFLGMSFSIGFDQDTFLPKFEGASNGANCLVFNDRNYNDTFDEEDEPLKGVVVEGLRTGHRGYTNENGRALISGFSPTKPVDIQVQQTSLPDLTMKSKTGYAIYAREGKIYDLHFPLHVVSDIEGFAYRIKNDEAQGRSLVPIQLVDEVGESIDEVWTEGDGFFLFMDVLPGTYTVRVAPDFLDKLEYASNPTREISVTSETNTFADNLLFYGEEKVVALLEEKFRNSAALNSDAFVFTDFSDLDEETEAIPTSLELVNDALLQIPDPMVDETKVESMTAQKAAKTPTPIAAIAPVPAAYDKYGLIVDTFISKKSAKRAVAFYEKKHSEGLGNAMLSYSKRGDAYVVIVSKLKNVDEMNRISHLFMCAPKLVDISHADLPEIK